MAQGAWRHPPNPRQPEGLWGSLEIPGDPWSLWATLGYPGGASVTLGEPRLPRIGGGVSPGSLSLRCFFLMLKKVKY